MQVRFVDFKSGLKLYPNPTSNSLTISNDDFAIESVQVINLQGQVLYKSNALNQNEVTIDLSNYSNGMYFVNVNNQTNIKVIKK